MSITATELKRNLGRYLLLAAHEDVFITKNGKVVARLSAPFEDRAVLVDELTGILPPDITVEDARKERLASL